MIRLFYIRPPVGPQSYGRIEGPNYVTPFKPGKELKDMVRSPGLRVWPPEPLKPGKELKEMTR